MTTTVSNENVVLKGGLSVDIAALRLLWALEDRGLDVRLAADGDLLVGPRAELSADDRAGIRAYRNQVVQLVRYYQEVVP